MTTIAIDCDLHKIYAWCDTCGIAICKKAPDLTAVIEHAKLHAFDEDGEPVLVTTLFEIAGPLDYTDSKATAYQKRRWTIWNVAQAARLIHALAEFNCGRGMFVSPSSSWTSGYPAVSRHKLAKATYPQYDVRECQAMVWSYRTTPAKWTTLGDFLAKL